MPTVFTIHFTDCAVPATVLQGVYVTDGYVYYTSDVNGDALVQVDADVVVACSKADYFTKNLVLTVSTPVGTTMPVCLNRVPPRSGGGGTPTGGCFIVSATTGSAQSAEVNQLRALRDRVAQRSQLAAGLIDRIYEDYYEFSPSIAEALEEDGVARKLALSALVRPLLGWYSFAGVLALEPSELGRRNEALAEVSKALASVPPWVPLEEMVSSIRDTGKLPAGVEPLLGQYGPRLQAAAGLPFVQWAIMQPLSQMMYAKRTGSDLTSEVAEWLSTAPISALKAPETEAELALGLKQLSEFFIFAPVAGQKLGARLAEAWSGVHRVRQAEGPRDADR